MDRARSLSRSMARVGPADCSTCPVRKIALLGGVNVEDMDRVRASLDVLRLQKDTCLYEMNAPADYVYSLRTGLVKQHQSTCGGRARIVRLALPGDCLGLEALVGGRYRHSATVLRTADVCRIPVRVLSELYESSDQFRTSALQHLQQSIDAADFQITQLSTGTAHARLARLLLYLDQGDRTDPRHWIMRDDMAAMLGVTLETVSRTISDLKRGGLLHEEDHSFRFRRADLKAIADS
ncbi:MAG: Crp/Fnr family transcriptional regulator [Rhodocyclaceae bacterium]|nr:Crp/Fnr family transcriptional regulator [Rhodocyclaceae bacterium]